MGLSVAAPGQGIICSLWLAEHRTWKHISWTGYSLDSLCLLAHISQIPAEGGGWLGSLCSTTVNLFRAHLWSTDLVAPLNACIQCLIFKTKQTKADTNATQKGYPSLCRPCYRTHQSTYPPQATELTRSSQSCPGTPWNTCQVFSVTSLLFTGTFYLTGWGSPTWISESHQGTLVWTWATAICLIVWWPCVSNVCCFLYRRGQKWDNVTLKEWKLGCNVHEDLGFHIQHQVQQQKLRASSYMTVKAHC